MNQNLVSVIMSTYNEPLEWVNLAVNSIVNQTYQNIELIIVLDNPKNKELYTFLKEIAKNDKITLVINEKNLGLAKSLNEAILNSRGEFIARMDADDISMPERIEKQIEYLKSNPEISLISNSAVFINEKNEILSDFTYFYDYSDIKKCLPVFNMLIHPTYFMRRTVLEKVGGYRIFDAAEDYDFALRVLDSGFNIEHLQDPILFYRRRSSSMSLGNGLVSQENTNYIKKLHEQRVKYGKDNYSYDSMKLLSSGLSDYEKQKYSKILINVYGTNKKNKIKLIKYCCLGLLNSKYFRRDFLSLLYIKYLNKKYRKVKNKNEVNFGNNSDV